ncbi:hypothetical protein NDU88_003830 [Pleurodeles waltl]|uniref:Uncharacterized protein n=1 Tax=Pleurodeles waltl TaxID=8319 RepID=A0AAV7LGV8_PLEWA|nr:hypothetical protein NDU88_003830 [Pleurodeles waltl]
MIAAGDCGVTRPPVLLIKTMSREKDPAKYQIMPYGDSGSRLENGKKRFQQAEDAWAWLHAKGLARSAHQENSEEGWSSPKEKRRRRPRQRTKPSVEQVAEERSQLLRETTRFVVDPLAETLEHGNSDQEHKTHSDSVDSLLGPLLTRGRQTTFDSYLDTAASLGSGRLGPPSTWPDCHGRPCRAAVEVE